jgi:Leucine-rich repeat (LRR) protein
MNIKKMHKKILIGIAALCFAHTALAQTADEKAWFDGLTPEFRKELRFSLDRIIGEADKMREPTAKDVAWISDWKGFFFSNYSPISDLAPLKRLTQLERLTLNNMPITSLEALRGINLYEISINFTNVTDLTPLGGMSNLERINLAGTNVKSLQPLALCSHLEAIDCRGTQITKAEIDAFQKKMPDCKIWYKDEPKPYIFSASESQTNLKWWGGLSPAWQQTLRNELALLHDTPSQAAIREMYKLKRLRLQKIQMPDGNMLDFDDLSPISAMPDLSELTLNGTNINSLEPLKKFPKLTHLECRETPINDLSPIANCLDMKYLDILGTQVSSLEPLKNMKKMRHLNIAGTRVSNLAGIPTDVLNFLNMNGSKVTDLAPLSTAKGLVTLEISHIPIQSLQPLRDAVYLESINLRQTNVSDLKILSNKPRLMKIICSETPISDLSPIGSLKELQVLRFNKTKVASLQPITNSQSLVELEFSDTPVKDLKPIGFLKNVQKLVFVPNKVESLVPLFSMETLQKIVICKEHYTRDEIRALKQAILQADVSAIDCSKM